MWHLLILSIFISRAWHHYKPTHVELLSTFGISSLSSRSMPDRHPVAMKILIFSCILTNINNNHLYNIIHLFTVLFYQIQQFEMPFCAENVCLEVDGDNGHLFGVGSRSHVTFIDDRVPSTTVGSLKSLDTDCGELWTVNSSPFTFSWPSEKLLLTSYYCFKFKYHVAPLYSAILLIYMKVL